MNRHLRSLWIAPLVAVVASSFLACNSQPAPQQPADAEADFSIAGTWRGEIEQAGWSNYPAVMVLHQVEAGKTAGTISYPSFSCGGTLTCLETGDDGYVFLETIERGNCKNGGKINLVKASDGSLSWSWSYQDGEGTARGTFERSE